jgi:hypothetical protein
MIVSCPSIAIHSVWSHATSLGGSSQSMPKSVLVDVGRPLGRVPTLDRCQHSAERIVYRGLAGRLGPELPAGGHQLERRTGTAGSGGKVETSPDPAWSTRMVCWMDDRLSYLGARPRRPRDRSDEYGQGCIWGIVGEAGQLLSGRLAASTIRYGFSCQGDGRRDQGELRGTRGVKMVYLRFIQNSFN